MTKRPREDDSSDIEDSHAPANASGPSALTLDAPPLDLPSAAAIEDLKWKGFAPSRHDTVTSVPSSQPAADVAMTNACDSGLADHLIAFDNSPFPLNPVIPAIPEGYEWRRGKIRKKKAPVVPKIVRWKDTAASTSSTVSDSGSPFLDLPVDVLDKIFATDLEPQDHLALSGVCRSLRDIYSVAVICALCYPPWLKMINKPEAETIMEAIVSRHLNGVDDDISDLAVLKVTKDQLRATLVGNVNQDYVTKTMAKKLFKVTDRELEGIKENQVRRRYRTASVRSLAFRSHGGPLLHQLHIDRLAGTAEKARATRARHESSKKGWSGQFERERLRRHGGWEKMNDLYEGLINNGAVAITSQQQGLLDEEVNVHWALEEKLEKLEVGYLRHRAAHDPNTNLLTLKLDFAARALQIIVDNSANDSFAPSSVQRGFIRTFIKAKVAKREYSQILQGLKKGSIHPAIQLYFSSRGI